MFGIRRLLNKKLLVNTSQKNFCEINRKAQKLMKQMAKDKLQVEEYKNQINQTNTSFSTVFELISILNRKILIASLLMSSFFFAITIYKLSEISLDPITKRKKLYILSYQKELLLHEAISKNLQIELKIGSKKDFSKYYEQIENILKEINEKQIKVFIVNNDEYVLQTLTNGDIFISKKLIDSIEKDYIIKCLILHELSHILIRSYIKNLKFSEITTILSLYMNNFNYVISSTNKPQQTKFIRETIFFQKSKEQEQSSLINTTNQMKLYFKEDDIGNILYNVKTNLEKINTSQEQNMRNYFKTHPYLISSLQQILS